MTFDRFEEQDNDTYSSFNRTERSKISYGNSRRPTRRNKSTQRGNSSLNGIHRRSNKRAVR